jgi:DNA-binding NtrC family response regulator
MEKEGGNVTRVADNIGIERTHLYRKLKQLGIKMLKKSTENDQ